MASRYAQFQPVDYCYHPIHVFDKDLDKDIVVPCQKCDGCLLHKANEWSMRVGMEIENTPATVFCTLTYSNKYLPKLYPRQLGNEIVWFSDHSENIRFNSVCDVRREDNIVLNRNYSPIDIKNWDNSGRPSIAYASKRDFQLWLKLVRKDLIDYGFYPNERIKQKGLFRYFIISEIGPETYRPHAHILIFAQSVEIGSYLLECSLYKNWKMCDEVRYADYAHFCDSGARGYVTQYLTSFSDLPRVYRENKEIGPFRLASKSPAIGFVEQDKTKVFQDVSRGVIKYTRPVVRLDSTPVLLYPKGFTSSLFPKCYRFAKVSDTRRFFVYSFLYRAVREFGYERCVFSSRLREIMHASDYLATCACYRYCIDFGSCPEHYYFLLDTYYYEVAMENLRTFYRSQESIDFVSDPERVFEYYYNIEQLILVDNVEFSRFWYALCVFFQTLNLNVYDYMTRSVFLRIKNDIRRRTKVYCDEVSEIVSNMVKMPKYNELTGNSPTCFT